MDGTVVAWLVPLVGAGFDLEDLPLWCAGSSIQVVKKDGGYFLQIATALQGVTTDKVQDVAAEQLNLLNGAARLLDPSHRPVSLETTYRGIDASGTLTDTIIGVGVGEVRAKAGVLGVSIDGVPQPDSRIGAAAPLLEAAAASSHAHDALIIFGRAKPTWSELYVAYELVKAGAKGDIVMKGWIDEDGDDLFTHTANSYAALGPESRHGPKKGWLPPDVPMEHRHAVELIRRLVECWLRDLASSRGAP